MKITYDHVTYRYDPKASPALKDVNLEVDTGSMIGICGMTGSGKTTFVQHINGILKPSSGRMLIDGEDIHNSPESLRRARRRIGMTFQFPERQLFGRTVWEELSYTLEQRQVLEEEIDRRITSVAERLNFDLQQHRERSPFALSRGEQRKLGIAVILSLQPELLVLDEPTAGMDRASSYQFLDLLQTLHRHNTLHIFVVSHNVELLLKYTDFLIILFKGEIVFAGKVMGVITASEQLERFGIRLPPVNRTLRLLQKNYPQINPGIISVNDAVAEITRCVKH
jgi:energy-coupling factor transport system ATP-binding protein